MASTAQKVLLCGLSLPLLTAARDDWDDFSVDFAKIFDQRTGSSELLGADSWKLSNGQIFAILITFFIVIFLTILCCASRRKNKNTTDSPSAPSPPPPHQVPSLCHSCQTTIHSMSQMPVSEDPYPPTYDSIYSTAQSRAMFLHHDQNRHSVLQPSAPPVNDLPAATAIRF